MTTTPPGASDVPPGAAEPGVPVAQPRSRKTLYVAGGVVGAVAIVGGAAAWAATSFFGTGPQAATALPSTTVAYVSVDLDPNGSQKIAAFKLLRKFPGLAKQIGSTDDIRGKIVNGIAKSSGCKVDFDHDVKPWLGNRAGFGLVGKDPVIALQVSDDAKAESGLDKLTGCAKGDAGFTVDGDWALVAETSDIAKKADAAAKKGNLADDVTFQKWTKAAGDPGIASFYVSPQIGDVAGDLFSSLSSGLTDFGLAGGLGSDLADGGDASSDASPGAADSDGSASLSQGDIDTMCSPDNLTAEFTKDDCEKLFSDLGSDASGASGGSTGGSTGASADPFAALSGCAGAGTGGDPSTTFKQSLADFKGAAGTLRVRGSGFELSSVGGTKAAATATGKQVMTTLPSDTAAAVGFSVPVDWGQKLVAGMKKACGSDFDPSALFGPIQTLTGLTFPDDVQTLLGTSTAVSVGSDLDPEKLANSTDPTDFPVAIKVAGDPSKIKATLAKVHLPEGLLEATYTDDGAVLSPDAAYAKDVAKSGSLGDDDTFKDLVSDPDKASVVLFVSGSRLKSAVDAIAGGDKSVTGNFAHFSGLGLSTWRDGDESRATLRVNVN